jgi:hypothetical protein
MRICGTDLTEHPLDAHGEVEVQRYTDGAGIVRLACAAPDFGSIDCGSDPVQYFQPGDYIVTDDPPTHAWAVPGAIFETSFKQLEQ